MLVGLTERPVSGPSPNSQGGRLWLFVLASFTICQVMGTIGSGLYPLSPYILNTNKEKKISSPNTFPVSGGTRSYRGMLQAIWVALCLRFHSCFLICGVINTEKRMKRDAPQPLSQGRGLGCQHFLLLKFLSYFFFLAIADLMKQR